MWYNINRNGQLGNRLFSRAHVYAAALEYGETVVDWGLLDIAKKFPRLADAKLPTYPLLADGTMPPLPEGFLSNPDVLKWLHKTRPRGTGPFLNYWSQHWGKGDPDIARLDTDTFRQFNDAHPTILMNGFKTRCVDWVRKHRTEITKFFELPESLRTKWSITQQCWHAQYSEVIGIHNRLTDFRKASGGRHYMMPKDFANVVRDVVDFDPKTTLFVFFSDESFRNDDFYKEIKEPFNGLNIYINEGDQLDDLCAMMHCDRLIGPSNSTFSRWAAFAAGLPWMGVSNVLLQEGAKLSFIDTPIPWDY
ncbi:MAG: hypothetical protein OQK24_01310 [Magnetovibrio sp.]|nr:hypothetical protein [Magnetovibrio sp.]